MKSAFGIDDRLSFLYMVLQIVQKDGIWQEDTEFIKPFVIFDKGILTIEYVCARKVFLQLQHQIPYRTVGFGFSFFQLDGIRQLTYKQDAGIFFKNPLLYG